VSALLFRRDGAGGDGIHLLVEDPRGGNAVVRHAGVWAFDPAGGAAGGVVAARPVRPGRPRGAPDDAAVYAAVNTTLPVGGDDGDWRDGESKTALSSWLGTT